MSAPFHNVASPNLVGRYYMTQKQPPLMVAMEIVVTMAIERVILKYLTV